MEQERQKEKTALDPKHLPERGQVIGPGTFDQKSKKILQESPEKKRVRVAQEERTFGLQALPPPINHLWYFETQSQLQSKRRLSGRLDLAASRRVSDMLRNTTPRELHNIYGTLNRKFKHKAGMGLNRSPSC